METKNTTMNLEGKAVYLYISTLEGWAQRDPSLEHMNIGDIYVVRATDKEYQSRLVISKNKDNEKQQFELYEDGRIAVDAENNNVADLDQNLYESLVASLKQSIKKAGEIALMEKNVKWKKLEQNYLCF